MLTLVSSSENLMGLSTDVKPLNVSTNTLFLELDTKNFYYFDGRDWQPVVGGGGGEPAVLIEKNITQNGDYSAADDDADGYSSVHVDVTPDLTTKTITQNGTYNASDDDADGYSSVTVTVASTNKDIEGDCVVTNNKCTGYTATIVVPNSVTIIDSYAFSYLNKVTSIELPSGLTTINSYAFQNCESLESIELPSGLTTIDSYAFQYCKSLESIELPSGVNINKSSVFSGCTGLKSIKFPSDATIIGTGYCFNCSSLVSIEFPSSLTSVGASAFNGCTMLASIDLPSSLNEIKGTSFANCTSLYSITCRATTPPTITSGSFNYVPATCAIYVPADSVATYKAANNWSTRADYIQAIPTA